MTDRDKTLLVQELAEKAISKCLPQNSVVKYERAYECFTEWCDEMNISDINEHNMLAYFAYLSESKQFKPTTLWSQFSMIKSILLNKKGINIEKYLQLQLFLKQNNKGYVPKKAEVFTPGQLNKFLTTADNHQYLADKVIAIFGISGCCRKVEIKGVLLKHVKKQGEIYVVDIPKTKNGIARNYVIIEEICSYIDLYINLRPNKNPDEKFFLNYRDGKCFNQHIGEKKISRAPRRIAMFLQLDHPERYTGHSFRTSSATILANAGASEIELKSHGGWLSGKVAEGYVKNSIDSRKRTSEKIFAEINKNSSSTSRVNVNSEIMPVTANKVQKMSANQTLDGSSSNINNENMIPNDLVEQIMADFNEPIPNKAIVFSNCVFNINKT